MKPRLIIGFSGWRGNGKTQASMYLAKKYGFKTVSFASTLKSMAQNFFPFTPAELSEKGKEKPYRNYDWTPRDFHIALGKLGRFFDPDFWVKKAMLGDISGDFSIDDVRFPNEVEAIKAAGGRIVRIERSEKLNVYGKHLDDPSETSLDNYKGFDYIIQSCWNVTLEDLHRQLDAMIEQFRAEDQASGKQD